MSFEHQHGEDLLHRIEGKEPMSLPLLDPRVQVVLAKYAFPEESNPIVPWLTESSSGDSLSSRFRAYIEDPANKKDDTVDIHSDVALDALLSAVKAHDPETLH